MSNDLADNQSIHAGGLWTINEVSELYDGSGVWLPRPSIHAFSPPMTAFRHNGQTSSVSTRQCTRLGDSSVASATSSWILTKRPHPPVDVPKTIAISSSPPTAQIVTDNEVSDDVGDDCSSVGMGTVGGKEISSLKRCFDDTDHSDDDTSLESSSKMPTGKRTCPHRQHWHCDTINKDSQTRDTSSIASLPEEPKWDGPVSYLDGLSENAPFHADNTSSHRPPSRGSTTMNDNVSDGTFDVSGLVTKVVHDPPAQRKRTTQVPCLLDDDSSASSDDDECEMVVVAVGSSIPLHSQENKGSHAEATTTESAWDTTPAPSEEFDMNKVFASLVFHETLVFPWENSVPSPFVK